MGRGAILAVRRANVALVINSLCFFVGLCGLGVGTSCEVYFLQKKIKII